MFPEATPRLRPDLVVREPEHGRYVIEDRSYGRRFALGGGAYAVLRLLDGSRDLEAVRRELEASQGLHLARDELGRLVGQLRSFDLLAGSRELHRTGRTERRGLLWMMRVLHPRADLVVLARRLRFMDRSITAATLGGLAAAGLTVGLTEAERLSATVASVSLGRLGLPVAVLVGVSWLGHELAHALVALWRGAVVLSGGFAVYYFRPALFCEVAGMKALARRDRLAISGAGLLLDAAVMGTALLLWRIVDTASLAADVALSLAAAIAARLIFNLNPLLKLDGYYLLADLLGRPELRECSFNGLRVAARALLPRRGNATPECVRLDLLEWSYALAALAYSGALIAGVALATYRFLRSLDTVMLTVTAVLAVAVLMHRLAFSRVTFRKEGRLGM